MKMPPFSPNPRGVASTSCLCGDSVSDYRRLVGIDGLTVIALGNSVLDASSLCQVGNFGPVLVCIGIGAESTAGAVAGGEP